MEINKGIIIFSPETPVKFGRSKVLHLNTSKGNFRLNSSLRSFEDHHSPPKSNNVSKSVNNKKLVEKLFQTSHYNSPNVIR
jgi:hypothetical protein